MRACTSYEMHISALMDGEATREDVLSILDHLPLCDSCQGFYREARRLQDVVDRMPSAAAATDAAGVTLDADRKQTEPLRGSGRWLPGVIPFGTPARWVWGIAATLLLALGFWMSVARQREAAVPGSRNQVVRLTLEEDRGRMSRARFVEMTVELLKSDRRYHRKMIEILERVEHGRFVEEGSVSFASNRDETSAFWEGDAAREDRASWEHASSWEDRASWEGASSWDREGAAVSGDDVLEARPDEIRLEDDPRNGFY